MAYRAVGTQEVKSTPAADSTRLKRVGPGQALNATGKFSADNAGRADAWIEVFLPDDRTIGWIFHDVFLVVPDELPQPPDEEFFVRCCMTVERQINADAATTPWYIAADFLLARALFETRITAGKSDTNGPIGPLAMVPDEWDGFLSSNLEAAREFGTGDRRLVLAQIFACGYAMSKVSKSISETCTARVGNSDGQYVPSYLDVFLGYLTNPETASNIALEQGNATATLAGVGLTKDIIASISARTSIPSLNGGTKISSFCAAASDLLAKLLDSAFERIKTLAADELPKPLEGNPAWLAVAQAELAKGVSETTNHDRIAVYFDVIKYANANDPWCGAFVGYCVKTAHSQVPDGPARAANWKTWGNRSLPIGASEIPAGAIVVLKPQSAGTSGHVAFFNDFKNNRTVNLLGGNQSNAVCIQGYPTTEISAIRLLSNDIPVGSANMFDMTKAKVPADRQRWGDLIIDRFRRAGFSTTHQLAAALANAIAESNLDPEASSPAPEKSYGLFQCNQTHGVGKGYTKQQLFDPDLNTALIIAEARRSRDFVAASTLEAAVEAFVKYVERPLATAKAIRTRLSIARDLLGI